MQSTLSVNRGRNKEWYRGIYIGSKGEIVRNYFYVLWWSYSPYIRLEARGFRLCTIVDISKCFMTELWTAQLEKVFH